MTSPVLNVTAHGRMRCARQVYLVLGTSVLLGAVFGVVFGVMDVEDARGPALRKRLLEEENVCLPIGIVMGLLAGVVNELLSLQSAARGYMPVHESDLYEGDI